MELTIYSEGKVSYTEAWNMSTEERSLFIEVLSNYTKAKNGDSSESNEYL